MDFVQTSILVFGLVAVFLTQVPTDESVKRYACIFGLISQPFFIHATYTSNQEGMFILSICHTFVWIIGFVKSWVLKPKQGVESRTTGQGIDSRQICRTGIDYLHEIKELREKITQGHYDNLYCHKTKMQMLDLLNDAEMISDLEFCANALSSLKIKLSRFGSQKRIPVESAASMTMKIEQIESNFLPMLKY